MENVHITSGQVEGLLPRRKLLVVSSYKRSCGIAAYVEALEIPLRNQAEWEIDIAALPVDLFKAQSPFARKSAARILEEICVRAGQSDVVSIQLEPGLYGRYPTDIWSRLSSIIHASKRVVFTYHTVPPANHVPPRIGFSLKSLRMFLRARYGNYVFGRLFAEIRKNADKFRHIVHTGREARNFAYLGIPERSITKMPLAFVTEPAKAEVDVAAVRAKIAARYSAEGKKIIGCFGFLAPYKGVETAIRALQYLPEEYHLFVVGGLHPEEIRGHTVEQPYLNRLLDEIEPGQNRRWEEDEDRGGVSVAVGMPSLHDQGDGGPGKQGLLTSGRMGRLTATESWARRTDLVNRVHFLGEPDNKEFNELLIASDAVVLPYAEVGQTSSGPAALALDFGRPLYCSHNLCFRELDKFQRGVVSFFEVGNHLELASKIAADDARRPERLAAGESYRRVYNIENRAAMYLAAADSLAPAQSARR